MGRKPVGRVFRAAEAAAYLKVHVETVRRLARRGQIPAFKVGRDWRFEAAALRRWCAGQQRREGA